MKTLKKLMPAISFIVLMAFLNLIMGCYYYKVGTGYDVPPERITEFQSKRNYIILHKGDIAWHFMDIKVNGDMLEGVWEELPNKHMKYKTTDSYGVNRYKKNSYVNESSVLNEVHIYTSELKKAENNSISVPITSITKIEIYDPAVGATTASWVFGTIGVFAAALAVIGIVYLLTKDSCPFIYTYNGTSYTFNGEIYAGAIYSSLERHDYMPLPDIKPVNHLYQLKISNELLERQYTNLAELLIIQHSKNTLALIDKYGAVQTISNPQAPLSTVSLNGNDYNQSMRVKDNDLFLFNEYDEQTNMNSLIMTFNNQENADTGKLVIHAKNSLWGDYVYGQFTELFGSYYNKWAEKQKRVPAEKNIKWMIEQGLPILVYLETETGWEYIDYFNLVGPLASRDMVMPIDLSKTEAKKVRIKLESGFMFWELDYAAMDFSNNIPVEVKRLKPSSAIDEKGYEVSNLLSADDKSYLEQFDVGNEVIVKYDAPTSNKDLKQTAFLHTKGYYERIRDYKGKPNVRYLKSFKRPGAFAEFSKEKFKEIYGSKFAFVKTNNN